MTYRTRSARRIVRKSKNNLILSIIISAFLVYVTISWILPNLIGGLGFINSFLKPSQKEKSVSENPTLAPPVLSIPFEATNTAQIDLKGYASPNSRLRIFLNDELETELLVENNGSFLAKNINLRFGTNNIYGKSVDEKDNESLPSKVVHLNFDDERPKLEISEPGEGKTFQGERKIKVSGKTEGADKVLVNDSQAILNSNGDFETNISLSDGDNNINVKALDIASNSTELTLKVTFQP